MPVENLVGASEQFGEILVELIDYSRKFTLGPVVSLGKYFTYILTYVISIQCLIQNAQNNLLSCINALPRMPLT